MSPKDKDFEKMPGFADFLEELDVPDSKKLRRLEPKYNLQTFLEYNTQRLEKINRLLNEQTKMNLEYLQTPKLTQIHQQTQKKLRQELVNELRKIGAPIHSNIKKEFNRFFKKKLS